MDMQNMNCCPGHKIQKIVLSILVGVVLIILGVYLIALSRNAWKNYNYVGKSPDYKNQVTFAGTGKVTATPDVAVLNIGIITQKNTVLEAQKDNTDKMNNIINALKNNFGIEAKDIQTSQYSINPNYQWINNANKIVGYQVNQNVTVKVRDFTKIGDIITKAGESGSNNISGPNFTIDDPEQYKAQAREKAIAQAKDKAKVLADQVGIKLGPIVNFYEDNYVPMPMYADGIGGMGGSMESLAKSSAPVIESGSQEVSVNVSISYEIR